MLAAIRQQVTVQPGGVIEIRSPELEPGSRVEVIVLLASPVGAATAVDVAGSTATQAAANGAG
jgi:hypothetical protein